MLKALFGAAAMAAVLFSAASPASAAPMLAGAGAVEQQTSDEGSAAPLLNVDYREGNRVYGGYGFFKRGGYRTLRPWWTYQNPPPYYCVAYRNPPPDYCLEYYSAPGNDASYTNIDHVGWCKARYRSYDERTDTYVSNSGKRRTCRSPGSY